MTALKSRSQTKIYWSEYSRRGKEPRTRAPSMDVALENIFRARTVRSTMPEGTSMNGLSSAICGTDSDDSLGHRLTNGGSSEATFVRKADCKRHLKTHSEGQYVCSW